MSTLASTAIPTVRMMPAIPGNDSDASHHRQQRREQHHVGEQHQIRDHAEDLVVDDHEQEHARHADEQRA